MPDPEDSAPPSELAFGELPELTRTLRALGSARRAPGPVQSMFFRPLLDARKRAAEARDAHARVRAFDAAQLEKSLDACVERIVAQWPDTRDAAQRAFHAQVSERLVEYRAALVRLQHAGRRVTDSSDPDASAWRAWTAEVRSLFETADRSWIAIQSVVEALTAKRRA